MSQIDRKEAIYTIKQLEKFKYSMIQLINDAVFKIEKTLIKN